MRSKWNGEPPYREIDFGFVFVRAVRAGETKLRGRARESLLWLRRGRTKCPLPGKRGTAVSRRCPAGVPWCRVGVPSVSRRCPVGVPWCPVVSRGEIDSEIDSEIDQVGAIVRSNVRSTLCDR